MRTNKVNSMVKALRLVRPLSLFLLLMACSTVHSVDIVLQDTQANPVVDAQAYWIHDGYAEKLTPQSDSLSIPADSGVVVVYAEGYQHTGLVLGNAANGNTANGRQANEHIIAMRRLGESGGKSYQTRAYPFDSKLKARLQSLVASKCWAQVKAKQRTNLAPYAFQFLGHMIPQELTAYLDNNSVDPNSAGMGRQAAIRRLATVDPTAALEQLDAFKDSMRKSMMISELLSSLPASSPIADTLELQFADATRTIDQPALRLASWAVLAEYYADGRHPESLPSVQSLADRLFVSPGYLSDLMRHHTGRSALQHIHDTIIDEARARLKKSTRSVTEIAMDLGFEYPTYFARLFKQKMKITPSEYRRKQ